MTRGLEVIDRIVNDGKNKDTIEVNLYTDFDKINEYVGTNESKNEGTE